MNKIFSSNFFVKFQAVNADDLIKFIDGYDETSIDDSKFTWGKMCSSNKILLKWEDTMDLISPNLEYFANDIKSYFNYILYDPWINLYKRGDHQEVHSHYPFHISCVFFANSGERFSKLYLRDRNSINLHPRVAKLVGYRDEHIIDYKEGDILFFPGGILHGVSPHNSNIVRKTLSFDFDIK